MKRTFNEEKAEKALHKQEGKAEKILFDLDELNKLLTKGLKKAAGCAANAICVTIPTLISMVISFSKKEYKDLPIKTIILAVSAILYFVMPIDLIPDAIPFSGFLDDIAVVGACINSIGGDLEKFKTWFDAKKAEKENNKATNEGGVNTQDVIDVDCKEK